MSTVKWIYAFLLVINVKQNATIVFPFPMQCICKSLRFIRCSHAVRLHRLYESRTNRISSSLREKILSKASVLSKKNIWKTMEKITNFSLLSVRVIMKFLRISNSPSAFIIRFNKHEYLWSPSFERVFRSNFFFFCRFSLLLDMLWTVKAWTIRQIQTLSTCQNVTESWTVAACGNKEDLFIHVHLTNLNTIFFLVCSSFEFFSIIFFVKNVDAHWTTWKRLLHLMLVEIRFDLRNFQLNDVLQWSNDAEKMHKKKFRIQKGRKKERMLLIKLEGVKGTSNSISVEKMRLLGRSSALRTHTHSI